MIDGVVLDKNCISFGIKETKLELVGTYILHMAYDEVLVTQGAFIEEAREKHML